MPIERGMAVTSGDAVARDEWRPLTTAEPWRRRRGVRALPFVSVRVSADDRALLADMCDAYGLAASRLVALLVRAEWRRMGAANARDGEGGGPPLAGGV